MSRKGARRAHAACRLHVALHGCLQSAELLGAEFYTKIGVNEWADTNRIVVLYPQAHATTVAELSAQDFKSLFNTNPQGCWNWWGYAGDTGTNQARRAGRRHLVDGAAGHGPSQ